MKDPKRILHLIDTTGPGGAETVYVALAEFTRSKGADSVAVIRGDGWVKSQLDRASIPTEIVDCKGSFNVRFLYRLVRIIQTRKIDLIQSHLLGSNVYGSLAGLLTGTPVVCTFHGNVDIGSNERLAWAKFKVIQLGARRVIAVSQQLGRFLADRIAPSKLEIIHNGIDVNVFKSGSRRSEFLRDGVVTIGALGNIREAKDYFTAIRAVGVLRDEGYPVNLRIAGGGKPELLRRLKEQVLHLGLSAQVEFLGFVDDPNEFLRAIDIYILSSRSEGHPLALVQAMAMSLPIVATRCGVEEILTDQEDSLLVAPGDPDALARAVEMLVKNAELRTGLAIRARQIAHRQFSLLAMQNAYWNVYCSSSGGQRRLLPWTGNNVG